LPACGPLSSAGYSGHSSGLNRAPTGARPLSSTERRNHYIPRTADGWVASIFFLLLMALAQPPVAFWAEERMRSGWVLGLPAFYVYLGAIYFAMIAVLIWAALRRI
jgi:hypothetical protein